MSGKKLGFGLMRLPSLDPNDPGKIDIEQVKKMVDTFIERGFTYFDTGVDVLRIQERKRREGSTCFPPSARQLHADDKAAFVIREFV